MNSVIIRRPSFNVDTLEGALLHLLSICHTLSDISIECFAEQYAAIRNKQLPENYVRGVLLPRLRKEHKIYHPTKHLYSLSPIVYFNEKGLNAFWVFLHLMRNIDIGNVFIGTAPAQISYIKNKCIYHIICCKNDGSEEMNYEIGAEKNEKLPRKYFFVFKDEKKMMEAKLLINVPSMFVFVDSKDFSAPAKVKFVDPAKITEEKPGESDAK